MPRTPRPPIFIAFLAVTASAIASFSAGMIASGCNADAPKLVPPVGCARDDGGVCLPLDAGGGVVSCSVQDRCGVECVDRKTDSRNCGQCGNRCTISQSCADGMCVILACPNCACKGTTSFSGLPIVGWGPNPAVLRAGDFDGDGKLDLALVDTGDSAGLLLGKGTGRFKSGTVVGTEPGPVDVVVGDFDGDKKLDMAIASVSANSINVFLGDGQGGFKQRATYATEAMPVAIAAGDFDGDGKLDLAAADSRQNLISVFMNKGGGVFGAQTTFATGKQPSQIAAADFDGDGKADLVTANIASGDVSFLAGAGNGSFLLPTSFAAGKRPVSMAMLDLNGDGKPDLALANPDDSTVSVLLNAGKGGFAARVVYGFAPGVDRVAGGDLDGDGKPDLVVVAARNNKAGVFLNLGQGLFGMPAAYVAGQNPSSIALGDFNGDGKTDVAIANTGYSAVTLLLGTGRGLTALTAPAVYPAPDVSSRVAAADLNGDGKPDLVSLSQSGLAVMLNRGDGALSPAPAHAAGLNPATIAIADFNGDGKLDLATANVIAAGTVSVLLSSGNGDFGSATSAPAGKKPSSVAAGDFNGDGKADLAVTNSDDNQVGVLWGDGRGGFAALVALAGPMLGCLGASQVVVGDLNGDGKPDLAVACSRGSGAGLFLNKGDGSFLAPNVVYTGERPLQIALADFNGDKVLDLLALTHASQPPMNVVLADGKGGYGLPRPVVTDDGPYQTPIVGDFDGDGRPDVATLHANYPWSVRFFLNRGTVFVPGDSYWTGSPDTSLLAAADWNGDGQLDIGVASATAQTVQVLLQSCLP